MPKMTTFHAEAFKNEQGQTINPGDEVLYMTSSRSYTSHHMGIYLGLYRDKKKPEIIQYVRVKSNQAYESDAKRKAEGRDPIGWSYGESRLRDKRIFRLASEWTVSL